MGTYEHKEKNNVLIYHDIIPSLEAVLEQPNGHSLIGKLFLIVLYYSRDGEIPTFSNDEVLIKLLFYQMKIGIDINAKKYDETCERNRRNRNKGNSSTSDDSQSIDAETGEVIEDTEENDSGYDLDLPTKEMIQEYFVKEKKKPLSTKDSLECLNYCITNSSNGRPWKQNADSWFTENKSSAV